MKMQIADELAMLAQQRASGALEISGNPGGAVFLSGGYLAFAESPAVPDLRSRLIRSQRLTADQWNQVIESDQAQGGVGALLVSRGIMTWGELRDLLRSMALDALIALVVSLSAEPPAASVRFWPRRSHWVGSLLRLDIRSVWADAEQKAEPLARYNIQAESHPRLCDLSRSWAVLKPELWALAWQIDGRATVRDLAWRNGFALGDSMEWVGALIQAGLCTVAPPVVGAPAAGTPAVVAPATTGAVREGPDSYERRPGRHRPRLGERRVRHGAEPGRSGRNPQPESPPSSVISRLPPAPVNGPLRASVPTDAAVLPSGPTDSAAPLLPQRRPGAALAARSAKAETSDILPWHSEVIQTPPEMPHADLLHRILKGLKRMD